MNDIQLAIELVGRDQGATAAVERVSRGVEGLGRAASAPVRALGGLAGGLADIAKNAVAFAAGGVLLNAPGALLDMARGAAADEQATARLGQAIKNLGGDVTRHTADVNNAIAAGQKLAFSDDDVRDSYISLAAATGDSDEALKRQTLAMDFARGAGIPLQQASKLLGKVTEENVEVFKRMGITIGEGATEAEAFAVIQAKFAGQAEAYAQSTAGQFEQAQIAFAETGEAVGAMVLPALTAIGNVLVAVLPQVQEFIGGLSAGISERVGPAIETAVTLFSALFDTFTRIGTGVADFGELRDVISEFASEIPLLQPFVPMLDAIIPALEAVAATFNKLVAIVQQALSGDIAGAIQQFLGLITETRASITDQMLEWARALVEWIVPMIPGMLAALGEFIQSLLGFVAENVSALVESLSAWAASFIDWIAPQIPGLLRELGAFAASMFDFLIASLPGIMEKLAEWGMAFVEWVAPRIPPLLLELGKLSLEVAGWILGTAIPRIVVELAKLGAKFVEWVGDEVLPKLPGALAQIAAELARWASEAASAAGQQAAQIGAGIIDGIRAGIAGKIGELTRWAGDQAAGIIGGMASRIRAQSPSQLAAEEVGEPISQGVAQGIIDGAPVAEAAVNDLGENVVENLRKYIRLVIEDGDTLNDWLTHLPDFIKPAAQMVGQFSDYLDEFGDYLDFVAEEGDAFNDWLTHLPESMRPAAEMIGRFIADGMGRGVADGVREAKDAAVEAVEEVFVAVDEAGKKASYDAWRGMMGEAVQAITDSTPAVVDAGTQLSLDAWGAIGERAAEAAAEAGQKAVDAYANAIDAGDWIENPHTGVGGGGGGSGGGSGSGSGGSGSADDGSPGTGGTYSGPFTSDPLYRRLMENRGWHAQVPGKLSMDFGMAEYNAAMDTVRGQGTPGTNVDKSGYYRVTYRVNSLLNARQESSVAAALISAINWVRDNTPRDRWADLGWTIEGRARGGPVLPGRTYLIGERGPELLSMGRTGGRVSPMGGAVYNVTVNVAGSVATERGIARTVRDHLIDLQRRNGTLGLTVSGGQV